MGRMRLTLFCRDSRRFSFFGAAASAAALVVLVVGAAVGTAPARADGVVLVTTDGTEQLHDQRLDGETLVDETLVLSPGEEPGDIIIIKPQNDPVIRWTLEVFNQTSLQDLDVLTLFLPQDYPAPPPGELPLRFLESSFNGSDYFNSHEIRDDGRTLRFFNEEDTRTQIGPGDGPGNVLPPGGGGGAHFTLFFKMSAPVDVNGFPMRVVPGAVPEAGTWASLGGLLGMAALTFVRRGRRRK